MCIVHSRANDADPGSLGDDLLPAEIGLLVLLVITVLTRNLIPYGWLKQREERDRLARRVSVAGHPDAANSALAASSPGPLEADDDTRGEPVPISGAV